MRLWTLHPKYLDPQGLVALWREALLARAVLQGKTRGYNFDRSKVGPTRTNKLIPSTTGQVAFEWEHLLRKLAKRNPEVHAKWSGIRKPACHPLFRVGKGRIEPWERP